MKDTHYQISMTGLNSPVPNMSNWTVAGLVRHYKRTKSLNNSQAVYNELLGRGKTPQEINELLTT